MILNIFKIGGSIVDNGGLLHTFSEKAARIQGPKIVVHGGGNAASQMCERLGIPVKMHEGRRITDEDTLQVAVMVYGGWANKRVVASLQAEGCNATGLTGTDGDVIRAHKRLHPEMDYGFAGDIDHVNAEYLHLLIGNGMVPVMAPLTHDGKGQLLNTNADSIAAGVSGAMSASFQVRLVYILDHAGVLSNLSDPDSVIPRITLQELDGMKGRGIISDGMIPKLQNARKALEMGADEVIITNVESLDGIGSGCGTRIVR